MMRRWVRRRIHISWLIAWASLAAVVSVSVSRSATPGMFESIAWPLSAVTLFVIALRNPVALSIILATVAGLLVGLWRGEIGNGDHVVYQNLIGSEVKLEGAVAEDTDTNARGQSVLRLKDIRLNNTSLDGRVWVTTSDVSAMRRSDIVMMRGVLGEGFGSFNAAMYSASIVSINRPTPGDIAIGVRDWFAEGVRRAIGEPESSLGLGYLVGQRRGLPEELDIALQAAGLTHIVVASGYNLTILVRFARRLFEKVSRYLSFVTASSMIVGFVAITGFSPSMSRAGLVAGLSLVAWYYGRRFHPLVLLPLAAAITVMIQPSYAWGDLGWQLSFAAFAGVMIMAPLISSYFYGDSKEHPLRRIFIETISAQIWTLPILLLAFAQTSIVAPIANILILPFVPLAMLLTFFAGIGGLAVPIIAGVIGFPAQALLYYMTTTASFIGGLPWAVQEIAITVPIMILLYIGIISACIYMWHKTKLPLEQTSLIE